MPKLKTLFTARGIAGILTPISVLLMESFWVFPWLVWAGKWESLGWQRSPLSFISVFALVGIGFLVSRLLTNEGSALRDMRATVVGIGLVTVFIIIRLEFSEGNSLWSGTWFSHMGRILLDSFSNPHPVLMAMPVSAYLWWRGLILGRAREYHYVYDNLIFGGVSYAFLVWVWWGTMGSGSLGNMAVSIGPLVAGFFFCGLAAMALGNLHSIERRIETDEPQRLVYRRWLPVTLGVVGALLLAGILIATASSIDFASGIKSFFGVIGQGLSKAAPVFEFIFKYLLMPFEWLAQGIIWVIFYFIKLFRGQQVEQPSPENGAGELPEIEKGLPPPESVLTMLKWLLFIVAVVVVTMLIMRSIRGRAARRAARQSPDFEETHESLWSWGQFLDGIKQFFANLWGRLWRRKLREAAGASFSQAGGLVEESAGTLHIRELFRRLLRESARAGITRQSHETPFEYAGRFNSDIPDASAQMNELTALYVDVRYGNVDTPPARISRANVLWRQIRELLHKTRGG